MVSVLFPRDATKIADLLGIIAGSGVRPEVNSLPERTVSMIESVGVLLVGTVLMVSTAVAQMAPAGTGDTPKGKALVDPKGMALYVFDKDKVVPGKSPCNGSCDENWPPLPASDTDKPWGDWTIVARDYGKKIWAYKGRRLYALKNNNAPGDTDGDEKLNGAWHIATP